MAISKGIQRAYQRLFRLSPFGTFALLGCLGFAVVGFVMEWIRADDNTTVREILIEIGKMEAGVIGMMLWIGFFAWAGNRTKSARLQKALFALMFLAIPPVIGVAMRVAVLSGRAEFSTYEILHTVIGGELVYVGIFAMFYCPLAIRDWYYRWKYKSLGNIKSDSDVDRTAFDESTFEFTDSDFDSD